MDPVRFAVNRPYTVAVAVILALLFSLMAYNRIPVQLKPSVEAPIISVSTIYRGAGPVEVEEQVTRKVEDLLQSVDGLDKLTSSSVEGMSVVTLRYDWGVDKNRAVVDVINKLSELGDLPPDSEKPTVALTSQEGGNAVMWIATKSHYDPNRVRQVVADVIEPRLERVAGVADLMVVGGEEREIRVLVDPERLASRGVTWDEMARAVRAGAVDLRGGTVETATRQWVVRTEGRSTDPQTLADIVVRRGPGGTVRVGDVATIDDDYRETTSVVHNQLGDIVAIGVRSEPDANVVTLIDGVDEVIASLNERFGEQGLDLSLHPVYRDTTYLRKALDFVWNSLGLGAFLAVCVLLAFLRSVRSVLVVALSIPVSLITVFLVMDAFGRTLNVVSLAGLAFAAGMVVDNAIVVLENTFRHLEMGKGAREAAVDAGREVWGGVLASTLTTIAVFVPVLGIKEEAGQLFADLALAISAAVGLSLIVSLTVVPCLASLLYRGRTVRRRDTTLAADGGQPTAGLGAVSRWYARRVASLTARGRGRVAMRVVLVAVVVAVSLGAFAIVPPAGYLPSGNANLVFFFGAPIPGTRPEALIEHLSPLEQFIKTQPETERYFIVIASGFNGGGVILKDEYANGPDLDAYTNKLLPVCFAIPGFRNMIAIRSSLFRDAGNVFSVEITGPDLDVLADAAQQLQQRIGALPAVQRVTSDYVQGRPELRVTADHHLASEAGLTVAGVGGIVETALAGRRVGIFSDGSRDFDINLVVSQDRISSLDELETLPVITPTGKRTTLGALADIAPSTGPQSVNRIERQRSIMLSVNLSADAVLQAVLDDVKESAVPPVLATLPREVRVEMGGSADKFSSTLDSLTDSFWLAILITYLLLVALFRSWGSPFVIMVSVPLALSGGLIGITLAHSLSADASFDLLSMLGFVILAGIVVNNAILIIHQSNNLAADGRPRREALAEASLSRLRPILMSVTTTVFGMAPLAIGGSSGAELYQGLAAVVVGGLILSTLFTLFLVPALVSLGWDIGAVLRRAPEPVAASSDAAAAGGGATGGRPAAPA